MKETGEFQGREVAVIGAARAGSAIARALLDAGAHVTVCDVRTAEDLVAGGTEIPAFAGLRHALGLESAPAIERAEIVVPSPGVRRDSADLRAARQRGATVLGEIEVAYRLADAPIVAVTGTNGKSTTTAMCGAMLQGVYPHVWVGGNLAPGEPFGSLVQQAGPDDVLIVEVSSFQLEQIVDFRPKVAVLTNLSPDHLDRHSDFNEYAGVKARIFENQGDDDFAVINAAHASLPALASVRARRALFSVEPPVVECGAWVSGESIVATRGGPLVALAPLAALGLPGRHNVENAIAAALAAWLAGASPDRIASGLAAFRPVAHRMEPVAIVDGVQYVNNSMCTNPAALVASLSSYEAPVVLIAGGRNKNLDFSTAGPQIAKQAKAVVLIGDSAGEIAAAIGTSGAPVLRSDSLGEAVRVARSLAAPGDLVMLAPGCASLDMFHDFMDRGERFAAEVRRLEGESTYGLVNSARVNPQTG